MERNVRYYYVVLSIVKKFPFIGIQIYYQNILMTGL